MYTLMKTLSEPFITRVEVPRLYINVTQYDDYRDWFILEEDRIGLEFAFYVFIGYTLNYLNEILILDPNSEHIEITVRTNINDKITAGYLIYNNSIIRPESFISVDQGIELIFCLNKLKSIFSEDKKC